MKQSEHEEQATLVQYLKLKKLFYFSVPNGAMLKGSPIQRAAQMNKLKREGLIAGTSDIIVMLPNKILFVEMKSKQGYASKEQKAFIERAKQFNYSDGRVCKGCSEAMAFIEEYL